MLLHQHWLVIIIRELHCSWVVAFVSLAVGQSNLYGVRLGVFQVNDDTLASIFKAILNWHITSARFSATVKTMVDGLVAATLEIYTRSMQYLLPTPSKSHYVFNLRDFARVIQASCEQLLV